MVSAFFGSSTGEDGDEISVASPMPLPNVWLGVSVEDQKTADERIPLLLQTPAAVRWVSAEPLLGALDLREYLPFSHKCQRCDFYGEEDDFLPDGEVELTCPNGCGDTLVSPLFYAPDLSDILSGNTETQLRWIVAGGESGPKGRPMHPAWTRTIRDQCNAAGVPFFFKQWGDFYPLASADQASQYPHAKMHEFDDGERSVLIGKKAAGRTLDGRTWDELPEVSQ
jgi:protein gp37